MALSDGVVIKTLDEKSQDESISAAVLGLLTFSAITYGSRCSKDGRASPRTDEP